MNNWLSRSLLLCATFFLTFNSNSYAQLPGSIIRQATSVAGRTILDPDGNGYSSATATGFGNNDITNSELAYSPIKAYPTEPFGDLRRGPNHVYSDFVPDSASNGVYYRFSPAQQVMFRMRLGSIISGSKGYSILMDTDGKFGATGAHADPNYLPSTTGVNGNPGFEIEIVLETNFRIAIYNVDGTSNPVLVKQYTNWKEMSQVSISSTNDNGDPDFFIDFYLPFSDLQAAPFNLTTASPIRFTATTVMAPKAAIGGPRSDIYGVSGNTYEDFIGAQPACSIFTTPLVCPTGMVTAAPSVNNPISTGIVNIGGAWTKSAITGAAGVANITVFKNGGSVGTVLNVSSGSTWILNSISLANGDTITAKAIGASPAIESMSLTSNLVIAAACNSTNRPATPALICTSGSKGLGANNLSTGWTVHVDNLTRNVFDNNVTNATGLFGAQSGTSPSIGWVFSGGCSSGAPLTSGSYKVYYTNNTTGCNSLPSYFCAAGNGGNALAGSLAIPTITTPANANFTTAATSITGTTDPNATVYLYINGNNTATTIATAGGSFTFSGLNLLSGQQLYIVVELNTGVVGTSKCANQTPIYTVTCFTQPPLIYADNNNQLTSAAPITGTSTDVAGTTVRIYTSTNTLVATTAVQANGTWSTGNTGTTPSAYNAIAATSYYANAQNGSCGVSSNSATYAAATGTSTGRCGTILGPVGSSAMSIFGTLTGSFTTTRVNLYLDGELLGTTTTTGTSWGPISVNNNATDTLYANGILTIGIQETGKQESLCSASALAILCTPTPNAPVYTLSSNSVNQNQNITCTISNVTAGTFYALSDSVTGQSYGQGKWATSNANINLNTDAFTTPGTYKVKVNATSLNGLSVCSSASATSTVVVNPSVLPLSLIEFKGRKQSPNNLLVWITENEIQVKHFEIERSTNGISFYRIAVVGAKGNNTSRNSYSFLDRNVATASNYYRLKIVDADGKFTYSNVISFKDAQSQNIIVSEISPNPFTDKINLNISLIQASPIKLSLVDPTGRSIFTKYVDCKKGDNTIEWNGMRNLETGVYYLRINASGTLMTKKILKVN